MLKCQRVRFGLNIERLWRVKKRSHPYQSLRGHPGTDKVTKINREWDQVYLI